MLFYMLIRGILALVTGLLPSLPDFGAADTLQAALSYLLPYLVQGLGFLRWLVGDTVYDFIIYWLWFTIDYEGIKFMYSIVRTILAWAHGRLND